MAMMLQSCVLVLLLSKYLYLMEGSFSTDIPMNEFLPHRLKHDCPCTKHFCHRILKVGIGMLQ